MQCGALESFSEFNAFHDEDGFRASGIIHIPSLVFSEFLHPLLMLSFSSYCLGIAVLRRTIINLSP